MQALWMLLASLFFATLGVCVKFASAHFNSAELVCYRGILGMLFIYLLMRSRGETLATRHPAMHAWRSLVGVVSLGAWFYAIGHLPLATAMTLNYMSSVWIAAVLVGGSLLAWRPGLQGAQRPPQAALILSVLAGFAGVVMVLRPSLHDDQLAASLIGLMSGMTAAIAYIQVKTLSQMGEPEGRTVFYFALGGAVAGAAAMALAGVSQWTWAGAAWLVPMALLATLGQLCMTRAYGSATTRGATLLVATLQYSGIVFSALYSLLLFNDAIAPIAWAGMALIVASGVAASILRGRTAPNAPAPEH